MLTFALVHSPSPSLSLSASAGRALIRFSAKGLIKGTQPSDGAILAASQFSEASAESPSLSHSLSKLCSISFARWRFRASAPIVVSADLFMACHWHPSHQWHFGRARSGTKRNRLAQAHTHPDLARLHREVTLAPRSDDDEHRPSVQVLTLASCHLAVSCLSFPCPVPRSPFPPFVP